MKRLLQKKIINIIKKLRGEADIDSLKRRGLKVGKNFNIQFGCVIDYSHCWHIEIGDDVTLAPRVHILAHDASTKIHLNYTRIGNVKIGNRVFIGAGTIILPGITIGDDVIVGAGSIVVKDIPNNSLAAGNPAKVIDTTDKYLEKQKSKMNDENRFDESYTLSQNISANKRAEMKRITEKYKQSFVI